LEASIGGLESEERSPDVLSVASGRISVACFESVAA